MQSGATVINLCGRLVVQVEGQEIAERLRGRQGRLLLAYLVLNRDRPVRRDELLEALWTGNGGAPSADVLAPPLSRLRSALGATSAQILALVLRQGLTLAALGVALGLVGAAAATRGLESLLYGVTSLDPLTYAGVILLLAAVAGAACWLPAARAARVEPTVALRAE